MAHPADSGDLYFVADGAADMPSRAPWRNMSATSRVGDCERSRDGEDAAMLSFVGLTACSVVGIREAEEPKFRVVSQMGDVQIREYAARIAAETTVAGDEYAARGTGFRKLAGYIFGANNGGQSIAMTAPVTQSKQSIAMTAPVVQARDASGWTIRFIMPSSYTMQTLPLPDDANVRLVPLPAETYAVLRFSGSTTPEAIDAQRRKLLAALANGAWRPEGEPVAWFYDPPWTLPFLRRNEVAVPVTPR